LVPALVDGNADAIFGGSGNLEGADLKGLGVEPVITSVRDLGIPDYDELVLVARSDQTEKEPDVMRDFVAATVKGSALATEQPKSALQALENAGERNPAISPKARKAEVSQTIPLLSTDGQVSPERMQGLIDWMYEEGMIKSKIPVSELLADLG
jgi:putative hydroxymethylpyrimidine transport system substrate-binding protein